MKFKSLSLNVLFSVLLITVGCEKEKSFETGNTGAITTGTSVFTFAGAPGACASFVLNGNFQAGIPLGVTNIVTAQVNVTTIGTYTIATGTANGVLFKATGSFTTTGLQTIVFPGTGTPLASGNFSYTLGTGGCSFSISFLPGNPVNTSNCKDCAYIPVCVGSRYEYNDTILIDPLIGTQIMQPRVINYIASVDTVIDSKTYQKITASDGTANTASYYNCFNGESSVIAYQVLSSTSGNVLVNVKSIELKANAAEGATWTDSSLYTQGNVLYRKHTIVKKGISKTLLGVNFKDIILVRVVQSVRFVDPPLGFIDAGTTEYYIAKNIGIVEVLTYGKDPITLDNYIAYHSVIKSYFMP